MARGDGGKRIFQGLKDSEAFLNRLEETCEMCGWRVHAWVLMGNHFHLLLETPHPNLVKGMKWMLGVFSQGWNRARKRRGHVFQGRYKSIPVSGSDADGAYFKTVADYIHLNPARAGLIGGKRGPLVRYRWSSLRQYHTGKGPEWMVTEQVLDAFRLTHSGRGRRAYVSWLEARAEEGGKISDKAQRALRRGWYLGDDSFKDKLLAKMNSLKQSGAERRRQPEVQILRDHGVRHAEDLIHMHAESLDLPCAEPELTKLPKGHPSKAVLAALLAAQTTVGRKWLGERLAMGHASSVSRQIGGVKRDKKLARRVEELGRMSD